MATVSREDGRRVAGRARQGAVCNLWPYHRRRDHDDAKRLAAQAVWNAIKGGTLTRQPCEACGNPDSEAHHADYNRPLDVAWLCRPHHRERDKARGKDQGERQEVRTYTKKVRSKPKSLRPMSEAITRAILEHVHEQRWTQRELGQALGVSAPRVHSIFAAGIRSLVDVAHLAEVLNLDISFTVTARKRRSHIA